MKNFNSFLKITLSTIVLSSCVSSNGLFYNGKIIQIKCENQSVSDVSGQDVKSNSVVPKSIILGLASEPASVNSEMNLANEGDVASLSNEFFLKEKNGYLVSNESHSVSNSIGFKKANNSLSEKEYSTVMYEKKVSHKDSKTASKDDVDRVVIIILCFFIPPLAVYLHEGSWTSRCTINLILTLLCGLPGVIHALLVVLK